MINYLSDRTKPPFKIRKIDGMWKLFHRHDELEHIVGTSRRFNWLISCAPHKQFNCYWEPNGS